MKPMIRFKEFNNAWEKQKLGDIINIYNNMRKPITENRRVKGSTPYYGANGIQDYVEGYTHFGTYILIAEDGAKDLNNYPIYYINNQKIWVNNHAHVISGKTDIVNNKFLLPLLKTTNFYKFIVGGNRYKLNQKDLVNVDIFMTHNLLEQKLLGKFYLNIESLITLYQHKLKLLELIKKGLLQKLFVNNNFKYPEIRFKEFSDAWEKRKLAQEVVIHSGKDYKHLKEGPIPVYGTGGYMCSVNEALSYKDAVGIGRKGTINNPYLLKAPFWTVDTLFYVTPKHKNIDLYFILFTFKNINWNQKDESTGVPSLSKKNIYDTYISLPNYNNQIRISEIFLNVSKLISLYSRKLELLESVKRDFLENMFI